MNNIINFNFEIKKHLKDKFKNEKWVITGSKYCKTDIPNIIKCIEITKSHNQNNFACYLSIYSNFNTSNSKNHKTLDTNKQIFMVGLTPNMVTSSSYDWPLKDDEYFNANQIHLLWNAIINYGKPFFNRFANFPEPFLNITPDNFNKVEVKLFNEYEVFNQINYMNFLKELHLSIHQKETATAFSNLAIKRFQKSLIGKTISDNKEFKKALKEYEQSLKIY